MRVARLPDGKTLEFPLHTPDDAIDQTVAKHMESHKSETEKRDKAEKDRKDMEETRHQQIMQGFALMAQMLAAHGEGLAQGHKSISDSLNKIHAAVSKPRKRRAIRDDKGKLIGAEEYD